MANRLINMAVNTSTFGAELITAENPSAARVLLDIQGGGSGGGEVSSVNGQVGAVNLDYADVGAASAAQGAKADTALQPGDAVGAISSVNGKTGTVVLNAADIGAATSAQGAKADTALQPGDIPEQAVTSVNGKTGAVSLSPSDVGAATAAQGSKADSAVQPSSLATVATTGSYNSLSGLPTLGTAASQSASAFATAAQAPKRTRLSNPPTW
ncbi:tail fiber protein [Xanthomonas phage pXoo2106]|uniref:Tail fiber protein n=1 Tax=Xanthomonas phage pXoo2106 TaxID=2970483 RepID=A0AAX3C0S5_9CAUD|nr:tail fiber protein [Xanthomonas phage pXoo2106]